MFTFRGNGNRLYLEWYRSPLTKIMTDNWHDKRNSAIENWHINNSRKDDRELKTTERPITITYKDNKKDIEKDDLNKEDLKILKITLTEKKENSAIEIMQKKKLDIVDEDKEKRMIRKGMVKEMLEKIER